MLGGSPQALMVHLELHLLRRQRCENSLVGLPRQTGERLGYSSGTHTSKKQTSSQANET